MSFGKTLHDTRLKKGFTASQMSEMLDISLRAYRFYESDSREPNFETLVKIATLLDVTTDYLLGRNSLEESSDEH